MTADSSPLRFAARSNCSSNTSSVQAITSGWRTFADQEPIRTHTSTAVVMQGTAVADVLPLTRTTGNDRNACSAQRTLQESGENIGRGDRAGSEPARLKRIKLVNDLHPMLRRVPKFIGDNSLLRDLRASPLGCRLPPINALPGFLRAQLISLSPKDDTAIPLVVQNVANGGRTPTLRNSSLLWLRRSNSFTVQVDGDTLQGIPSRVAFEKSAHRWGLIRVDLKFHSFDYWAPMTISLRCALNRHPAIPEDPAAGVETLERTLLDTAKVSLRQVFQI